MSSRKVQRRLRTKLAVVALVALAGVAALTIPNLAGAITSPSISSPSDNALLPAGSRTVAFSMPADDSTETSYTLLRGAPSAGACNTTARGAAGPAGSDPVEPASPPTAPTPIVDDDSIADGVYCYWIQADDSTVPETAYSSGVKVTYDATPPPVQLDTQPASNSNDATPTFTFSSTDGSATFECSVDGASFSACTSGAALSTLVDGPHTFAVKAIDLAGNHSTTAASYSWTIDTAAPTATIGSTKPGPFSNDKTPAFSFTSSEPTGATFECAVDAGSYSACASGDLLSTLSDGPHTFHVKAIDQAGNHSSAASYSWTVDTAAPTATIGSTKPGPFSSDATPAFSFTSSEPTGATFECAVDAGSYSACASGDDIASQSDGPHTFHVKAIDQALNHSTSAASYSWTVDTAAPTASIDSNPALFSSTSTPSFSFSSSEPTGATFQCSVDGASYTACTSPKSLSLSDGPHAFAVETFDRANNLSAAASYSWTVDTVHPTATIGTKPAVESTDRVPVFSFSSSEPTGATFECSLDGGSYATCTSGAALSSLGDGSHTFTVKAIDQALNHSTTAASYTWTVDTTAPSIPGSFLSAGLPANQQPKFFFNQSTDANYAQGSISYRLYRDGVYTGVSGPSPIIDSSMVTDGSADGSYTYTIRSIDPLGNESADSSGVPITINAGPPSVPGNVRTAAALTRNDPTLSWNASTGTPAGYRVVRNGQVIGTVSAPTTTFTDSLPLDGSMDGTYTYTVIAVDSVPNASAPSSPLQITLDTQRPSPSSSLVIDKSPTSAKPVLVWPGSASGDVAGYNVYRGGSKVNGSLVSGTSFTDTGLAADGTYVYTVRAVDKAGNESSDSMGASVLYDTTAPGTPGASAVAAASGGMATVSWSAASDAGSGVASYQVRRSSANGAGPAALAAGTPVCGAVPASALGCADSGLTPGASYRYSVFAIDAVGNVSPAGQTSTISIPTNADKTPPKAPTALKAVVANGQIALTWKNPKSDLATVWVVWNAKRAPKSSSDGNSVYHGTASKLTVKLPKLAAGKELRFAVFAADKAGNVSVAARATIIMPRPSAVSLAPNGKLSGSPDLTWNAVTGATYYNVQVFEGTQASKRVAIGWPAVTKYTLPGVKMKKGKVYTWYVWPGIGAKSAAKYGKLIGKVTFTYSG